MDRLRLEQKVPRDRKQDNGYDDEEGEATTKIIKVGTSGEFGLVLIYRRTPPTTSGYTISFFIQTHDWTIQKFDGKSDSVGPSMFISISWIDSR